MKYISTVIVLAFLTVFTVNAQEKKIKFNKGTLKICSSKNFKIEGYNGNEVIIESSHDNRSVRFPSNRNGYLYTTKTAKLPKLVKGSKGVKKTEGVVVSSIPNRNFTIARGKSNNLFFSRNDASKKEGLKRLGKKQENKEFGIFFTIEQKNGELIFKDNTDGQFVMFGNESYTIKIPNTLKLHWDTSNCGIGKKVHFYNSKVSSLTNFNGEVEISTSLNNLKLVDVTGPVSINSIGGNVTISFDKKKPLKLYSIYTNNGFIDITMPSNSDVNVDANGAAIYSDLNFNVLSGTESEGQQHMKLKMKSGRVKMKLEAGFGTIYLRKKK
ncbi:MAG: hypothetical protein JKY44_09930 [Flavobacteriaceae bacterium]|nr:hypothetical protein [Flavobacteriaceae bacterium]